MSAGYFTKDPDAVLDYTINWGTWLRDGETITASTWTVPDGLTAPNPDTHGDDTATVWLGGGVLRAQYRVTNHVVTSDGRQDDRTLIFEVVHK